MAIMLFCVLRSLIKNKFIIKSGGAMVQKHYFFFGETQNKFDGNILNNNNWDVLRTDESDSPFAVEKTVLAYENNCKKMVVYEKVAKIIVSELEKIRDTNTIVSLGSGKGILEWHLKHLKPTWRVECTDYAAKAIEKLKDVFVGADDIYTFDIINGNYDRFKNGEVILFYRVSTEFDRDQWVDIFQKMYDGNISNIVFVPTGIDKIFEMIRERFRHILNIFMGRKDVFCGWLYSEREFLKMFHGYDEKPLYRIVSKIPFEKTAIYILDRNA